MLKTEKKLIDFIEKHILVFQLLLITILALYIRRIPVWWNTEEVGAYFDLHENFTQSILYYLVVRAVQYLPMLPIHSIKWLSVWGDFGTAVLCLLLVREKRPENKLLQVFCYTLCLFSPILFLRGVAWGQIDSLAVALFLLGWLLFDKGRRTAAGVSMLLAALLYPCMIIFVVWFLWYRGEEKGLAGRVWINIGILMIWLVTEGVLALLLKKSFAEGLINSVLWLWYDPVAGAAPATVLSWVIERLIMLSVPGSVIGSVILIRKKKGSCFWILIVHCLILILYGSKMFAGL